MTESFDSYKLMIKNLQNKIKELREQNLKLEDRVINILNQYNLNYDFITSTPPDEQIYNLVTDFIKNSKKELVIASKAISSDITDFIVNKITELDKIIVIQGERQQIQSEDSISSFDTLASTPRIQQIINPNLNSTFIIKDEKELILISSTLEKIEMITKFNVSLKVLESKILEKYLKFYKEHLPSFMRY